MTALVTSKADRINRLLDSLHKTTRPTSKDEDDRNQAFCQGLRFVGCPLIDALTAAGRVLGDGTSDLTTLNTALDALLAELEERLL